MFADNNNNNVNIQNCSARYHGDDDDEDDEDDNDDHNDLVEREPIIIRFIEKIDGWFDYGT